MPGTVRGRAEVPQQEVGVSSSLTDYASHTREIPEHRED
jgi:hypothetical protein